MNGIKKKKSFGTDQQLILHNFQALKMNDLSVFLHMDASSSLSILQEMSRRMYKSV